MRADDAPLSSEAASGPRDSVSLPPAPRAFVPQT
jgi:hypothetical protein